MQAIEKNIGKKIATFRTEKAVTQARLAELIDVATETVSRFERGISIPSLHTLEKISLVLNVPLRDFFEFESPTKTESQKEIDKISVLIKTRKPSELRIAFEILKALFASLKKS